MTETEAPETMIAKEVAENLIRAVVGCPNGVQKMSVSMPGLVQTSSNLARVVSDGKTVKLQCLLRSSVNSEKEELGEAISAVFELAGAKVELTGAYNGWKPNLDSPILAAMKASYKALFGKEPAVTAIHAGLECGSFSSAIFNHRTDEYGGSAERRARFAVEAVKAVHAAVPGMAIDYKLAVRQENPHYGNAGVVEEELAVFVPLLVQAGVTSFHVTLANHSALENTIPPASHPEFKETGCFLKFCDEVRRYTSVPLCGVGGLNDPDFVEQQLASGRIQCAAMCRQLLADPNWVNKLQSGNAAKIHRCVRCNKKCLGGLIAHQGTRCIYDALNAKEQGRI